MASAPIRDLLGDQLITPQNAALALIDYQPSQIATSRSMDVLQQRPSTHRGRRGRA
jgi:hypothetical protein